MDWSTVQTTYVYLAGLLPGVKGMYYLLTVHMYSSHGSISSVDIIHNGA
jgi:hypothetical protein